MLEIETLTTFDTKYPADSVEFLNKSGRGNLFAVGCYKQQEENSKSIRKGRIYLFSFDEELNELKNCQQIETDAILDQKWMESNETILLNTANSQGKIESYQLQDDNQLHKVQEITLSPSSAKENLVLSIDNDPQSSKVLASDSLGNISLVDLEGTQKVLRRWNAHSLEAWTTSFDKFNKHLIYSGGDDSKFCVWDLRDDSEAVKVKSATRNAGITSFLSYKENVLLVGGYDDNLFSYDLRNLRQPTDELNLKGGVWRIKPSAHHPDHFIVACMYHNFSIVNYSPESNLKLVGEYFGHDSICYGCDWSSKTTDDFNFFATCSFYDHKLDICKIKI